MIITEMKAELWDIVEQKEHCVQKHAQLEALMHQKRAELNAREQLELADQQKSAVASVEETVQQPTAEVVNSDSK
jgi:hypothetical protein